MLEATRLEADFLSALAKAQLSGCIKVKKRCVLSLNFDLLSLLGVLDFEYLTDKITVNKNNLRVAKDGECWKFHSENLDAQSLTEVTENGYTIIINGINKSLPLLEDICLYLSKYLNCSVQANAYFTPPKSTALPIHFDTHDVLVYQVLGTKDWKTWDKNFLPNSDLNEHIALSEQTLKPFFFTQLKKGDWMYLPSGLLHQASTSKVNSLHITFGLFY